MEEKKPTCSEGGPFSQKPPRPPPPRPNPLLPRPNCHRRGHSRNHHRHDHSWNRHRRGHPWNRHRHSHFWNLHRAHASGGSHCLVTRGCSHRGMPRQSWEGLGFWDKRNRFLKREEYWMFGLLGFIGTKTHYGGNKMRENFYLEG